MKQMYLKEWCLTYISTYKYNKLKQSTYESYTHNVKHIPEELSINCSALDIQLHIIDSMCSDGLSYSTIKHVITIIRQALKKAYMLGMINNYPALDALEMPENNPKDIEALTPDETDKLLDELDTNNKYYDLFLFLLLTGCRVGEALALTWKDIDFINRSINIDKTNYRGHIQTTKTKKGRRIIPMTDDVRLLLFSRHGWHIKLSDNVFRYNYYTVRDAFVRCLKKAEVHPCGLHVLRHTYTTDALRQGMNIKVLSSLLGHANVQITLDIYCSLTLEDKRKEAELISLHSHSLPRLRRRESLLI